MNGWATSEWLKGIGEKIQRQPADTVKHNGARGDSGENSPARKRIMKIKKMAAKNSAFQQLSISFITC